MVQGCQFYKLGAPTETFHSLDTHTGFHQAVALRVVFIGDACNYTVEVQDSNFTEISSAANSPVYVNLSPNGTHNRVSFTGCFFVNNKGFFGGAMFVRFGFRRLELDGNATYNYVLVQDSTFEGNFGRQEGGAVFVRYSGYYDRATQRTNCMVFRRVRFIENKAGPVGTYPGGALISKGSSRSGKRSTSTGHFDDCSGPLTLESCTFERNAGFGAFFTRYTNTRFTGNT